MPNMFPNFPHPVIKQAAKRQRNSQYRAVFTELFLRSRLAILGNALSRLLPAADFCF